MRTWDIFCKVIDNLGDIGVCWRLAADLASRHQRVRLWVDDPRALSWMAPGALEGRWPGVKVMSWTQADDRASLAGLAPAQVWVEGFGCEPPPGLVAQRFTPGGGQPGRHTPPPVWINLEYLSAEDFVARSHGLPSPLMVGPARGHVRWFFYPGFTPATGGLLREPDLARRRSRFDRTAWLASQGIDWSGEQMVSLLCYEPAALPHLLRRWQCGTTPTRLLVTHGRSKAAVVAALGLDPSAARDRAEIRHGALSLTFLAPLSQRDFDHLLWACELNFVRGEDSLVRALWARKAFVWQIYPQHDDAHHAKLRALLRLLEAPPSWRLVHEAWNAVGSNDLPNLEVLPWTETVARAERRLAGVSDLTTRLLAFVEAAPQEDNGHGKSS